MASQSLACQIRQKLVTTLQQAGALIVAQKYF
jgi:hypothetical protein